MASSEKRPFTSFVDTVLWRCDETPEHRLFTFLRDGERDEDVLTLEGLDRRARAVGAVLSESCAPGARVILLYPPGIDYIVAFFGCLYGGFVAVPAYPPDPSRLDRTLPRLQAIALDAGADVVLTTSMIQSMAEGLTALAPDLGKLRWLATDTLAEGEGAAFKRADVGADTLAFLQYTSGSTGAPKGVMLTHGNLLANEHAIQSVFGLGESSVGVGWLPLYHDMGLIGNVLQTVYTRFHCVLMSPLDFLQRPARWLEAIHRYGGTTSGGPNFAFELCVRKVPEADRPALDLRTWSLAFSGAEPVKSATLERFADAFACSGFSRNAFLPCYGLAEATLLVAGRPRSSALTVSRLEISALEEGRAVFVSPASSPDERTREIVSCGPAATDTVVLVVDRATKLVVPDGQVGEIWVSGSSVANGYWGNRATTDETFGATLAAKPGLRFLRTGDLGFLADGEVFVCGRSKDLIIVRGRNYYPQDIESVVEASTPAIRAGGTAAFGLDADASEAVVVAAEIVRPKGGVSLDVDGVILAIRRAVSDTLGVHVSAVALLEPGSLPKTSSGKVQRAACKAAYLASSLSVVAASTEPAGEEIAARAAPNLLDRAELERVGREGRRGLVEQHLRQELARVLRMPVSHVASDARASMLGVDSLMAVEVAHAIERAVGATLPATLVLRDATVAELADVLLSEIDRRVEAPVLPDRGLARDPWFPMSLGQKALWFLHELTGSTSAYNIGAALGLRGPLSRSALTAAFRATLARHTANTAMFAVRDDAFMQREEPEAADRFELEVVDVAGQSDADIHARAGDEVYRPFDLERGPVFRATLLARGETEHVLVVAAHHIATDLWSFVVLLSDLRRAYRDAIEPSHPISPRPDARGPAGTAGTYRDFVAWQAAYLSRSSEADFAHWQRELEGIEALEVPTDRPRPAVATYRGAAVPMRLDAALLARASAFAKARGTTLSALLLTTFGVLLGRISEQQRFAIGVPAAGRPEGRFERTVGYFVNPMPLVVDLTGDPSFAVLLEATRARLLDGLERQHFPFGLTVDRIVETRDPSRSPLFQVMFVHHKAYLEEETDLTMLALSASERKADFAGLEVRSLPTLKRTERFDLTLALAQGRDELAGALEYNADLFDHATAERLAQRFVVLLEGAIAKPELAVRALPILSDEEQALLRTWRGPGSDPVDAVSVHGELERWAAVQPDAIAVDSLSYGALNRRANQVARALRHRGVVLESRVVTCVPRSEAMIVAQLATMKTGAAYVSTDPSYPPARVALIAEDARAELVITTKALADAWAGAVSTPLFCIDDEPAFASEETTNLDVPMRGDAGAYLIYTSGTTGAPKGVVIPHRPLLALASWVRRRYELAPGVRLSQIGGPAFDASVFEIWPALLAGASLFVVDDETRLAADRLRAWLIAERIAVCWAPTALAEQLLEEKDWRGAELRYLLSGGDRLGRRPGPEHPFVFVNGYGPCECTVQATLAEVAREGTTRTPSIGRPIGCFVYVLDADGRPSPIGVPGELCIGGGNVGRGYTGQPALTAARFQPDPFSSEAGARMYRSGDRVRFLADGRLEFLGRIDHQVKVRGMRVELGEIESALRSHPAVLEAVVLAREDIPNRKRLVAYLTTRDGVAFSGDDARAWLAPRLPEYMLPAAVVQLSALPLTRNGKLDRAALPTPPEPGRAAGVDLGIGAIEDKLLAMVRDVLGSADVSVDARFFELGLSSLDLVKLQRRVASELGVRLPMPIFFEHPTVREIAPELRARLAPSAATSLATESARSENDDGAIAIIGMAGRFPGAATVAELWERIREGTDCLSRFSPEEATPSPLVPEGPRHPRFVGVEGVVDAVGVDEELWRPSAEARHLDLQAKLFLDAVLATFEDAGYDPWSYAGNVAVYGGASSLPLVEALVRDGLAQRASSLWAFGTLAPDTLPMRAAHTFGLRGEAMAVNTACSTGLSAVHLACQSLRAGRSSMAVAVAANVPTLQRTGYVHEEGTILSRDGVVRPFDAAANGVVIGHGVGAVLLKPLASALRDGDPVYAVVRATMTNNDGHDKVGYTAPSVNGQVDVIVAAHEEAGVSAAEIGYVEAHGTGTALGDPIELSALAKALQRRGGVSSGSCAIGSIKANVGHLDTAAGMAGIIKTALVLHHGVVPPLANFREANREIEVEAMPFRFPVVAAPWPRGDRRRVAGVSSFGIGGTNAHAVLEDAPAAPAPRAAAPRGSHVVEVRARTEHALDLACDAVAARLEGLTAPEDAGEIADIAFTLATRKLRWPAVRAVVGTDGPSLARALRDASRRTQRKAAAAPSIAFVYAGMGSNPAGLGAKLYESERAFQAHVDACHARLAPEGFDVRHALVSAAPGARLPAGLFGAALFTFSTAITATLAAWGVRPAIVIGHSIGEYAAAYDAGALTLDRALDVIAARCHAMDAMEEGAMLVAMCDPAAGLRLAERHGVEIAAHNGPATTVFSGSVAALAALKGDLKKEKIASVKLPVDRALHSKDVEPVLSRIADAFAAAAPTRAEVPFVSTVTGSRADDALAAPSYWTEQMRRPVYFADALRVAAAEGADLFVEIGPTGGLVPAIGMTLGSDAAVAPTLAGSPDARALFELVARLAERGAAIDWPAFWGAGRRRVLGLPLHPRPSESLPKAAPVEPADAGAPSVPSPVSHVSAVRPRSGSLVERITALWSATLKVEAIDPHAHFLELGGSSLLAVELVGKMRDELQLDIALAEVFSAPTIAELVALLTKKGATDGPAPAPALLEPAAATPAAPPLPDRLATNERRGLSAVQQRVLAAHRDPAWGPTVVNMAGAVRLRGALDVPRLARSLATVVRRHEALHTRFVDVDGNVVPEPSFRPGDLALASIWCESEGTAAREEEARAAIRGRLAQPFDLARELPLRAFLIELGPDDHVFAVVAHHMVVDAPSLKVVFQNVLAAYHGAPLPERAVAYSAFAARQRGEIASDAGRAHASAWRDLPARSKRVAHVLGDAPRADASICLEIGADVGALVLEVRKKHGVSTFVAVAAALATTLAPTFRTEELVLSTPFGNRDRAEHVDLVGYVAHCMLIPIDLDAARRSGNVTSAVQASFSASLGHASVPFETIVLERSTTSASPFSDACLVVHEEDERPLRLAGMEVTGFSYEKTAEADETAWAATMGTVGFLVHLRPDGTGGRVTFCYPTKLFAAPERIVASLGEALARLANGGERPSIAEPASPAVVDRLERIAKRSPLALRLDGVALSHAELEALVASAAEQAAARGIGPAAIVDVVASSRVELVVLARALQSLGARVALGRDDAPRAIALASSATAPSESARDVVTIDLELPRSRGSLSFDDLASPIGVEQVAAARALLAGDVRAHLVWDEALPANRVLALVLATIDAGGLVSDPRVLERSIRTVDSAVSVGLAYFPVDEERYDGETYRLLLEGAKRADEAGLSSVFAPERHFHPFGGTFPDPTVALAALASTTRQIGLRAGSVVLPLHDPITVAERWSMIDVMSAGRVGMSIATGWRMEDFILAPTMFAHRKEDLRALLETLRALWRGEAIERRDPSGKAVKVRVRPRAVQPELPVWLTCAGSPASFALAGELGAAVLTMPTTGIAGLAENIAAYRKSFAAYWNGAEGHVTVLVSTFVHDDATVARDVARPALERYLGWSLDIGQKESKTPIPEAARARFLAQKAEQVITVDGLVGDVDECRRRVEILARTGADEIACLVDFGIDNEVALRGIDRLGDLASSAPRRARWSRLPVPTPLEHRERREVWLRAKNGAALAPAAHRRVLVEDEHLVAETSESLQSWHLSAIQTGIFLDELRFARPTYNNPFLVRSERVLDVERLRAAVATASLRHDMLRSRFVHRGGKLLRLVDDEAMPVVKLALLEPGATETTVIERARIEASQRFDLANEHPLRLTLYTTAPEGSTAGPCWLLICLHHIAGDVVSGTIALRDVMTAYESPIRDPWEGAPAPASYAAVAASRETSSAARDDRLAKWLARVDDAPHVLAWPSRMPRPPRLSGNGTQRSRLLSKERLEAVRAAARKCRVTLPTFLFTAFAAMLHFKTQRRELLVGSVTLGRSRAGWQEVVGPLFNMLPIRSVLDPGASFAELARKSGAALMEAMVEDEIGLAEIIQRAKVETTLSRAPLLQFLFNYIPQAPDADGSSVGITSVDVDWGVAILDVDLTARERGDDLVLYVTWSDDALTHDEGADLLVRFESLLDHLILAVDAPLLGPSLPAKRGEARSIAPGAAVRLGLDGDVATSGVLRRDVALPADVARGVARLAETIGVPAAAIVNAALVLCLARHSGQSELTLGVADVGAAERTLEAILGVPSAVTCMQLTTADDPRFEVFAARVAAAMLEARGTKARDTLTAFGGDEGIGVVTSIHDALPIARAELAPAIGLMLDVVGPSASAPLRVSLDVDLRRLSVRTTEDLARRLATLLGSAVAHPERPLSALDLLPESERIALDGWNATTTSYAADASVERAVAEHARVRPDAVAVVDDAGTTTYASLDAGVDTLARRLARRGVGIETRVAVVVPRSTAMVTALLAVGRSGGTYVPIDPSLPKARIAAMLEDARVTHVIASATTRHDLPETSAEVLLVDDASEPVPSAPSSWPTPSPDHLAYVMFTSGSTGRPKGVQIPRRALANFLASMAKHPGLEPSDVLLAVTTVSFDISGLELYLPLVVGARVVLAGKDSGVDGARLRAIIDEHHVTIMQATPTTFRLLLAAGWQGGPSFKALVGGEAVPLDLTQQLASGRTRVFDMYGPTETTIWSTVAELDGTSVVVGKPIANTQVYVLGPSFERQPIGVKGELYIGGDGLARGYEGQPALTAERFHATPFGRLYRTGDLARIEASGDVACFGRLDGQIKLRGYRIELGEIESVLERHANVRGAVVLKRELKDGDARLVAFCVGRSRRKELSAAELTEHVKASLPAYMVPSTFVVLEAFPLNASGKIDKRALGEIDLGERRAATTEYEVPKDEMESLVSAIWSETLGVPRIGRSDNFFDLGGNSMLALQAHGKLTSRLGRDFPIIQLFTYTTVATLAKFLASPSGQAGSEPSARVATSRDALLEQAAQRRAERLKRRTGGRS